MNKISVACAVIAAGIVLGGAPLGAESKKDVSDPVLQEIIATFGPRMPRFIDKHGKDLFVADETITRGGLMNALYEYDKSLKLPRKDFVTRAEFEELRAKLAQTQPDSGVGGTRGTSAKIDVMQVINDLQPNMPYLLDNSLNDSKVFKSLREEVLSRSVPAGQSGGGEISKTELNELAKRIDKIERAAQSNAITAAKKASYTDPAPAPAPVRDAVSKQDLNEIRSKLALLEKDLREYQKEPLPVKAAENPGAYATERMRKELEQTRLELAHLNKRITEIERTPPPSSGGSGYAGESRSSYTAALTKISLGLSMVAALFIAR